jgi:hypothetical protein
VRPFHGVKVWKEDATFLEKKMFNRDFGHYYKHMIITRRLWVQENDIICHSIPS